MSNPSSEGVVWMKVSSGHLRSIIAVGIVFAMIVVPISSFSASASYTSHLPITIGGNNDFIAQGWPGSGTISDPYILQGLEIDATGNANGICINNTNVFFKIMGCRVYNANSNGILLATVTNGCIADSSCYGNHDGIGISYGDNNSIINNVCTNNTRAGIYVYESLDNLISKNNCSNNLQYGICIDHSDMNSVSSNEFSGNTYGFCLKYSDSNSITLNRMSENSNWGALINDPHSSNNMIWKNAFYHNNGAGDTYDPGHMQAFDSKPCNSWNTSGTPNGFGNYWSDWNSPDMVAPFGIVDLPYKGPGMGGVKDFYPLTTMPIVDLIPPSITITSPTTGPQYNTSAAIISLAGTASDNVALESIAWSNNATGANGVATGLASWSASGIAVRMGLNTITVTAHDSAGYSTSSTLIVNRSLTWSSSITLYDSANTRYLDGDIAKGANYLYTFADEYKSSGSVYVRRSVDGTSWSAPTTVMSGLSYPHGGFCIYTVGGKDNIIVSCKDAVYRSTNNGSSYSSLASIGSTPEYTAVATNASMNPARAYDNNIYIAGNIGVTGIYLKKSINDGASWSTSYTIMSTTAVCPTFVRNSAKLYCIYSLCTDVPTYTRYTEIYVKNSTDWGKTWGTAKKIYTATQLNAFPDHAQYIDEQRCLITISDVASPTYSNSRGVYGYFWYGNDTFQAIGFETGSAYNNPDGHTYTGIAFNDAQGVNYTSLWCYWVNSATSQMKTHYTHGTNLNVAAHPLPAPRITNFPSTAATVNTVYSYNASATSPDNGPSAWTLASNASWLSMVWSNNTNCLVRGTPSSVGTYWANLTVSDLNSSDFVNWTFRANIAFSSDVTVYSTSGLQYLDGDLAKGANYLYAYANEYLDPGRALIKKSTNGLSWSSAITVLSGLDHPHGGFCVYTVGGTDNIICSSLGFVKKSTDNGVSYTSLTSLPNRLDYTAVATNASMDPSKSYDGSIYIAGNIKHETTGLYLTKSLNNGGSWSPLYTIVDSYNPGSCPTLMSDGETLYCFYGIIYDDLYVKSSADWGMTWGSAKKIYSHVPLLPGQVREAFPGHAQYIDDQRCLLTVQDLNSPDYTISRGIYGYFWYGNDTFQAIGFETGSTYNNPDGHTYSGIAFNDAQGVNYTSLWCYCVSRTMTEMKTHYTHGTSLNIVSRAPRAPLITNSPTLTVTINMEYSYNASATVPDNGLSTWVLSTNAPWLTKAWSNNTNCLVKGTPSLAGTYWANLTVSDLNSSDYVSWTFTVEIQQSSSVTIYSSSGVQYLDGDIGKGVNYLYALSDEYSNPGRVFVKRSVDGSTWSSPTTIFSGLNHPHAGFCVYTVGGTDQIIVSSLGGVAKSSDNGATYSSLTSLSEPLDYTAVATNMSMGAGSYDGNIYIAGNIKFETTGLYLTKSVNDGASWSQLYTIVDSYNPGSCPVLMSDGDTLYCFYGIIYNDLYVKSSSDWGETWSAATKIYSHVPVQPGHAREALPGHAQYIDDQRCLLTVQEIDSPDYTIGRGIYGYFWYGNSTFQVVGYETGPAYNNPDAHTYAGIAFNDAQGVNYTSLWAYCVSRTMTEMKTHYTHGTGLTIAPVMTCTITSPTNGSSMSTNWHMIYLRGMATDDAKITSVTWSNSLGGSGIAYMTPQFGAAIVNWQSRGNILLYSGINVITVTAYNAAGNSATDILTVIYMPPELTPPTVTITDPTCNPTMTTGWHMIYLRGTAMDNIKVTSVTWTNSLGGSGIAYMTPQFGAAIVNWQSRGNVNLLHGVNVITVTATDSNGNTATDVLTVTYTGL
jgi:parallel beta-helix repeat protein